MTSATSSKQTSKPIREWHDIDEKTFSVEVLGQYKPAVLRGLVKDWTIVREAKKSPEAVCGYVSSLDAGTPVDAILMRPEAEGRVFYNDDMNGFNFLRNKVSISAVIGQLTRYAQFENPPSVAVQSALIAECLPHFMKENKLPFLSESILPRIWLGNRVTTPAHMDTSHNIACVVSGTRRFTLFPPEQVANLYIGPLDFAPTASPISMVDFKRPDYERHPRFSDALQHVVTAELEPGDAIYIPALWWHHVESLKKINILVNYWWKEVADQGPGMQFESLLNCIAGLKHLPPEQKAAWAAIFNHYVFNVEHDPAAHIPVHARGILGGSPAQPKPVQ
ncbi:cupin-like domain-containing protein [Undibacterium sp.]|uniref:cupin-like domain-containing protein n=1 Tax=Undibacterium sp. TaxID=1914977 RepID=UPI00374C92B2